MSDKIADQKSESTGILGTWNRLTIRQQISALVATGIVIFGCVFLYTLANREQEALLFSGLDGSAAGEIAAELDGLAIDYAVRGSAIYVPVSQRDRLRIEMARLGLPAANGAGYELLDNLNGFSTTADMFDAAYWRAKEGELTRTIVAMPSVRTARVHLGVTRNSAFRRGRNDKSASVTIDAPLALTGEQAKSIQYLTALAVPELMPENVAVIDTQRGVIAGPGGPQDEMTGGTDQAGREKALTSRLTQMLEAHVGSGNAQVSVALELNRSSVAETQRIIDPDSRQIAKRELSQEQDSEMGGQGIITVASNLPDSELEEPGTDNPVLRNTRNENTIYTGTETERVTQQLPGNITKLSIAVLLNERYIDDGAGNSQLDPRSPEELTALETLISRAAGIDADRGDQLTIQVLPFEVPAQISYTEPTFVEEFVMPQAVELAQMAFMSLIVLVVGLFIVKPVLSPKKRSNDDDDDEEATPSIESMDAAALLTMLTQENPDNAAAILDDWFEKEADAA